MGDETRRTELLRALKVFENQLQESIKDAVDGMDLQTAQAYMDIARQVSERVRPGVESLADGGSPGLSESRSSASSEASEVGLDLPTFGFVDERFYRVGESQSRPDGYYRMSATTQDIAHVLEVIRENYTGDNRFSRNDLKRAVSDEIKGYMVDLVVTAAVEVGALHPRGHGVYAVHDVRLCSMDAFVDEFGDLPEPLR